MNAAARALAQSSFTSMAGRSLVLSSQSFGIILLIITVIASALAVVYVKDLNRHLFSQLQTLKQTRDELQVQWGQLLLEQDTWAASTRVQAIAGEKLKMSLPIAKEIVLVTYN